MNNRFINVYDSRARRTIAYDLIDGDFVQRKDRRISTKDIRGVRAVYIPPGNTCSASNWLAPEPNRWDCDVEP